MVRGQSCPLEVALQNRFSQCCLVHFELAQSQGDLIVFAKQNSGIHWGETPD
jgi:hypothetical protein